MTISGLKVPPPIPFIDLFVWWMLHIRDNTG